tara:strand:+ start:26664 stop:27095 length:432 start_codon:yes stop_codon:yes gene_type:complete
MSDFDLFYIPQNGFWQVVDRIAFESENLLMEWPECSNPFITRMACFQTNSTRYFSDVGISDLTMLIAAILSNTPGTVATFRLTQVRCKPLSFNVVLIDLNSQSIAPIQADNACSFAFALEWVFDQQDVVEFSATDGATYWIHK